MRRFGVAGGVVLGVRVSPGRVACSLATLIGSGKLSPRDTLILAVRGRRLGFEPRPGAHHDTAA